MSSISCRLSQVRFFALLGRIITVHSVYLSFPSPKTHISHLQCYFGRRQMARISKKIEDVLEVWSIAINEISSFTVGIQMVSTTEHGRQHGVTVLCQCWKSRNKFVPTDIERYDPRQGGDSRRLQTILDHKRKKKLTSSNNRHENISPFWLVAVQFFFFENSIEKR